MVKSSGCVYSIDRPQRNVKAGVRCRKSDDPKKQICTFMRTVASVAETCDFH